jgi:poly(hydroxyalkanoate) depolymerase family esterase
MFLSLKRAITKAQKQVRPSKLVAQLRTISRFITKPSKTAGRTKAVSSKLGKKPSQSTAIRTDTVKPRASLKETVRRISAGGMPEKTKVPLTKRAAKGHTQLKSAVFSSLDGKRNYKMFIPTAARQSATPMPLVIMLHGCTQTPDDFATGTDMNRLAEEFRIMVAYPGQSARANRNKCWNWYKPSDQARDGGEPALIAGIATQILRTHNVDPRRVYVAGLSAGGAAAAIVATAYPDIFAAVGVHSGLPIGAAQNGMGALFAMQTGSAGNRQTVPMPTIIFHGEADTVVNPRNGRAVAARSVATFPELTEVVKNVRNANGHGYRKTSHRSANRKSYCEYWAVDGAGHAWFGGKPEGSFTDPAGPDASREMLRFFLQHRIADRRFGQAVLKDSRQVA